MVSHKVCYFNGANEYVQVPALLKISQRQLFLDRFHFTLVRMVRIDLRFAILRSALFFSTLHLKKVFK